MKEKVLNNINKYKLITPTSKIIVGVSGGADSVALLSVLNEIRKNLGFNLIAVHINHNLRGDEAKRDEQFVQGLCKQLNVECITKNVDVIAFTNKHKMTVEQGARELRYLSFKEVLKERDFYTIAVAHNANDQAETVLMHLFRGAGVSGIEGMRFKNGNIIRPLLNITKNEILKYLEDKKLDYVVDSSNLENKYTRNSIRNEIMPKIEELYPIASQNICAFAEKMSGIKEFIESKIDYGMITQKTVGTVLLSSMVATLTMAEIKLLIKECFKRMNGGVDIEEKHILQVVQLLNAQTGKRLNMPHKISVLKRKEGVEFSIEDLPVIKPFKFDKTRNMSVETNLGTVTFFKVDEANIGDGNLYLDLDKVPSDAVWRCVENGDKFAKFSGGTKLVSDFLTDKKIDSKTRKHMLVLASGKDVFVIPNVEISSMVKIEENTKCIGRVGFIDKSKYCTENYK